jgi:CHAT domain-containing protein
MTAKPLSLTVQRGEGNTITMDFGDVSTVVPRNQHPVEEDLLTAISAELARVTVLAGKRYVLRTAEASVLLDPPDAVDTTFRHLGDLIFSHLFPISVRQRLASAEPTDLFLRLYDKLVHIPWELAFDGQHFLCSKFRIGRQVIADPRLISSSTAPLRDSARLKMLIIADPTESLPAAAEEADQLCDLLDACRNLDVSVMGGKQLRKIDLLQALNEYDLVHYAGHATFDPVQPGRSGWVLDEAVLTAAELRQVKRPPLLVFSNACQAGATTPWQPEPVYEEQAFGIGSAFVLAGTQNYIGTFCVIHDAHSAAFAADFYRHLLQDQESLGEALSAARHRAYETDGNDPLWASYMHYGDPTFRLPVARDAWRGPVPPGPTPGRVPTPPPTPPRSGPTYWKRRSLIVTGAILGLAMLLAIPWWLMRQEDQWTSKPLVLAFAFERVGDTVEHRLARVFQGSGRIIVVEREKLHKILEELKLSVSDLADPRFGPKVGKLLAARLFAFDTFEPSGEGGTLGVRLVETETSVVQGDHMEYFESPDALDSVVQQISGALLQTARQKYPLQGRITDVTSHTMRLNIGTQQGVTAGLIMHVFGHRQPLPIENPIGQITVTRAEPEFSYAEVLQGDRPVQRGWRVKEELGR